MLDALIDHTKRDLKKIKKKEAKLNTQNAEQMAVLQQLSKNRETLVSELKDTANTNHALMEELEIINQQIHEHDTTYESHIQDHTNTDKKKHLLEQMSEIQ